MKKGKLYKICFCTYIFVSVCRGRVSIFLFFMGYTIYLLLQIIFVKVNLLKKVREHFIFSKVLYTNSHICRSLQQANFTDDQVYLTSKSRFIYKIKTKQQNNNYLSLKCLLHKDLNKSNYFTFMSTTCNLISYESFYIIKLKILATALYKSVLPT